MTPRHIIALAVLALASVGTAFADPPSKVYITTGTGQQVLAITIHPSTGLQVGIQTLDTAPSPVTDVTQRSDGGLFYATESDIRRVGQATPVASVAGVRELRFSAYNCLFYNRAGGVNSVAGCGNPATPSAPGGTGLGLTPFGQLLAISGTTVVRIPLDALGNKETPTVLVSSGLTSPSSIAVAAGKGANGLERGDFIVTDGRFARLYDGKTGALKDHDYASVPDGQTINFADFDADDHLWLAAMVSNAGTTLPNGRVYRAGAGGAVCQDSGGTSCTRAALVPKRQGKYWPAVGLALDPSGRSLTQSIAPTVPNIAQAFTFDLGGSIVEINGTVGASCELQVRGATRFAQDATALFSSSAYSLNPYLGDEGFPTVYHIKSVKFVNNEPVVVPASACFTGEPFLYIAALTSTEKSPRILRCESGCTEIDLFGWWHTDPIEGDGEGGGKIPDFSDWLIVDKTVPPAGNQIQFCGVGAPLKLDGTATFNPGSTLTVKAQFSVPGGSCQAGMFLTDPNVKFLISLAKVLNASGESDHDKKRFIGASGNSGVPPTLGLAGQSYDFELSLKEPNGDNYAEGVYEITLTDVTATGVRLPTPVTIYFRLGKK